MGDLRNFAKTIRIRGEAVEKNSNQIVRRVALAVDSAVVLATPVDTGRARANWRAGLGEAPSEVLPAPSSPGAGASDALQQAAGVVAGYRGGEIHIANSLPYIGALNDGHSSQAPVAFVETSVAVGVRAVQSVKGITGELEMETDAGPHAGAGSRPRRKGD